MPSTSQARPAEPTGSPAKNTGLLAWVGTSKFVDGLPLNRIAPLMEKRFNIPFTSTTLAEWMIKGAERLITPLLDAMSTAFTYIHNQWQKLTVFLEDGRLALDNNKAERHIRPIAVGRKVWLFAQSEAGAKATASWYSLVETAKARNRIDKK